MKSHSSPHSSFLLLAGAGVAAVALFLLTQNAFTLPSAKKIQLNRVDASNCAEIKITSRRDQGGGTNNINIFRVEDGENLGTQLFDLARNPPFSVCADFGFFVDGIAHPIGFLGSGVYAVVEHGPPYSGACDGQADPLVSNYADCRASENFVGEVYFTITDVFSGS